MKTVLPIKTDPLFVSRYESAVIIGVIQAQADKAEIDITGSTPIFVDNGF